MMPPKTYINSYLAPKAIAEKLDLALVIGASVSHYTSS